MRLRASLHLRVVNRRINPRTPQPRWLPLLERGHPALERIPRRGVRQSQRPPATPRPCTPRPQPARGFSTLPSHGGEGREAWAPDCYTESADGEASLGCPCPHQILLTGSYPSKSNFPKKATKLRAGCGSTPNVSKFELCAQRRPCHGLDVVGPTPQELLTGENRRWRVQMLTVGEMPENQCFQAWVGPHGQKGESLNQSVGLASSFGVIPTPVTVQKDGPLPETAVPLLSPFQRGHRSLRDGQGISPGANLQVKMERQTCCLGKVQEEAGVTSFAFTLAGKEDSLSLGSCSGAAPHFSQSGAGRRSGPPCTCGKSCRLAEPPSRR